MSLIVKICGLSTREALDVALDAGADMVGFVFFPPSPRHISFEAARLLGERVRGRAQKVALTVDADDACFDAIIAGAAAGHAAASRQGDGGARRDAQAAFRPAGDESRSGRADKPTSLSPRTMPRWPTASCSMRARRRMPPGRAVSVRLFDWRLLENLDLGVPFMLSGGLDAGNVARGLRVTRARRRCVLRSRARAGREGSRQDPRLHPRGAAGRICGPAGREKSPAHSP